jgi:hypothetical protein
LRTELLSDSLRCETTRDVLLLKTIAFVLWLFVVSSTALAQSSGVPIRGDPHASIRFKGIPESKLPILTNRCRAYLVFRAASWMQATRGPGGHTDWDIDTTPIHELQVLQVTTDHCVNE